MTREKTAARETDNVDHVDVLPAFVLFALDPMSVQVREQAMHVRRAVRVPIPLPDVVAKECFIREILGRLQVSKRGATSHELGSMQDKEVG